jgi:DNA-binding MarR family transcriptional regulator
MKQSKAKALEPALVREFSRFYLRHIGPLQKVLLSSPYSLTEVRVMYELSLRSGTTGLEVVSYVGLNRGYISRVLSRLGSLGLVGRMRSSVDRRVSIFALTNKGRRVYSGLDLLARSEILLLLNGLSTKQILKLLASIDMIRGLPSPKMAVT